jgi:hypothetical protein
MPSSARPSSVYGSLRVNKQEVLVVLMGLYVEEETEIRKYVPQDIASPVRATMMVQKKKIILDLFHSFTSLLWGSFFCRAQDP